MSMNNSPSRMNSRKLLSRISQSAVHVRGSGSSSNESRKCIQKPQLLLWEKWLYAGAAGQKFLLCGDVVEDVLPSHDQLSTTFAIPEPEQELMKVLTNIFN
ncbi:hypothetical protein F9C07_1302 [Aspergillus flavus]|uniref:Uncharacterized protein n=3 Tax=Aspergillus subgen. Circumdati TaxID=2720871 RepID=A0A7U2MR95_ASPFN|nr:unnamed protein product [Aspergillus oryzae RIB40]EIT81114.1 hypothetical protein Ao3042_02428 [Aspergillus oryzae 3.042]KDE81144.1 hypothetical protein AO1008_07539 [Aspergillus oryzae 100-8]QRD88320.1 hypothetical protein F9C07_1302 [Aspergillus flavus]BAE56223.1 unnamed protein product [Aspergillus oryzae RIB40]|eukprot:EIT81114.1 hypothetical protein Ao3042_02428 [Aspergillus oryzae 3.042]